ncbi:hypothetical protein BBK14_20425 [Parafrankia soli]|uniref:Uncharacterized protein n=1 Tax=Parafrankia soli TaxID=2599596 RepID=A0A1S1Q1Q6_9ACTN|nr:hypothetical protein [Parafrankia soli]OHV27441.1 hypothetical protein BBK14_20425 [Parafrankia soli]
MDIHGGLDFVTPPMLAAEKAHGAALDAQRELDHCGLPSGPERAVFEAKLDQAERAAGDAIVRAQETANAESSAWVGHLQGRYLTARQKAEAAQAEILAAIAEITASSRMLRTASEAPYRLAPGPTDFQLTAGMDFVAGALRDLRLPARLDKAGAGV